MPLSSARQIPTGHDCPRTASWAKPTPRLRRSGSTSSCVLPNPTDSGFLAAYAALLIPSCRLASVETLASICRPYGTWAKYRAYPALKRWAFIFRARGAQVLQTRTSLARAADFAPEIECRADQTVSPLPAPNCFPLTTGAYTPGSRRSLRCAAGPIPIRKGNLPRSLSIDSTDNRQRFSSSRPSESSC